MLNLAQLTELHAAGKLIGLFDVEETAYHAFKAATSQSTLKKFKLSAAHAKAEMERSTPPTPAMEFGSAFHCATLEPKRFDAEFVVAPKLDKRTTAGKEAFKLWESENVGKKVIDADDMEDLRAMRDAVRAHEVAGSLTTGVIEKAAFWIDEATGIFCKCKPDSIVFDQGVMLDLKSTRDEATEKEFARSIANFGYHIQAAFYIDGVAEALRQSGSVGRSVGGQAPDRFVFLVVEKAKPFGVALFELDAQGLHIGRELYRKYLQELAICRMENHWPSYRQGIQTIAIPAWAA